MSMRDPKNPENRSSAPIAITDFLEFPFDAVNDFINPPFFNKGILPYAYDKSRGNLIRPTNRAYPDPEVTLYGAL